MRKIFLKDTYKYKYLCDIKGKHFEIISNLEYDKFQYILFRLSEKNRILLNLEVKDCIEFQYEEHSPALNLDTFVRNLPDLV